jgi:5-methylcytosine-specific restriction endonuclease McrA
MGWLIGNDEAWFRVSTGHYRHYSGSIVKTCGRSWHAISVDGRLLSSQSSALNAVIALQEHDRRFWTFDQFRDQFGSALYGDVQHRFCPIYGADEDEIYLFRAPTEGAFSENLKKIVARRFFGKSLCIGCNAPLVEWRTRSISEFDTSDDHRKVHLVCHCGYPAWRMPRDEYSSAMVALNRLKRLAAGGEHSSLELEELLRLQNGRCLYCNKSFTEKIPATKDHVHALSSGGSDWSLNIVLACRSCNSSRGDIPFRTFCKLKSPSQNKRILGFLRRRLLAIDTEVVSGDALRSFLAGLASHDRNHRRYLDIQKIRPSAKRNARANRLLPRSALVILKSSI